MKLSAAIDIMGGGTSAPESMVMGDIVQKANMLEMAGFVFVTLFVVGIVTWGIVSYFRKK